jgi:hypothetical protein
MNGVGIFAKQKLGENNPLQQSSAIDYDSLNDSGVSLEIRVFDGIGFTTCETWIHIHLDHIYIISTNCPSQ